MGQNYAYLFTEKYANSPHVYIYFIELLYNKFPNLSRSKILEVASGYIPGLAILINELYKPEEKITCVDPKLIGIIVPRIIQKKKNILLNALIQQNMIC